MLLLQMLPNQLNPASFCSEQCKALHCVYNVFCSTMPRLLSLWWTFSYFIAHSFHVKNLLAIPIHRAFGLCTSR